MSNRWVIGLDADDTLWENEEMFAAGEALLREILAPWADGAAVNDALLDEERRTLSLYGYGVKGFALSMIATAIRVSGEAVPHSDLLRILDCGESILREPVALLPGVADTVARLAKDWDLLLITKGDQQHQQRKIDESGLITHLIGSEVVDEKDPATYQRVLTEHGIEPTRFVMVGNSWRSDIEPVLTLGGWAIHIPYHITWDLELAPETETDAPTDQARHRTLAQFRDLPDALTALTARTSQP